MRYWFEQHTITKYLIDLAIFVLIFVLLFYGRPRQYKNTPQQIDDPQNVVYLDDGSRALSDRLTVSEDGKSAERFYEMRENAANRAVQWTATVRATRNDDGTFTSSLEFLTFNNTWYEKYHSESWEGGTLTVNLTLGRRIFYFPTEERKFPLTLAYTPDKGWQ